jgi:hypothetical protein
MLLFLQFSLQPPPASDLSVIQPVKGLFLSKQCESQFS